MNDVFQVSKFLTFSLYALCGLAILLFLINLKWRIPRKIFSLISILIIVEICWYSMEYFGAKSVPAKRAAFEKIEQNRVPARQFNLEQKTISSVPVNVPISRSSEQIAGTLIYTLTGVPAEISSEILMTLNAQMLDAGGNAKLCDSLTLSGTELKLIFIFNPPAFIQNFQTLQISLPSGTLEFSGTILETIAE